MLRESREAGNVKSAGKAHPQRSRPGFVEPGDLSASAVHVCSSGAVAPDWA
jgi:hypothetical protein